MPLIATGWLLSAGLAPAQPVQPPQPAAQVPTDPDPSPEDVGIRVLGGPAIQAAEDKGAHARPGGARRREQLFISPSGEPFRAKPGAPYPVALWFDRANTTHDGKLTRAQFIADAKAFFATLDTNKDGVIDGFENQDYEQKIVPEILPRIGGLDAVDAGYGPDAPGIGREAGTPRRRGGGGGGRRRSNGQDYEGAAPYSLINEPQPVMGSDANFDQRVTLDEFVTAAGQRFDLLDKKHLGYLTLADLPKTPVQQVEAEIAKERKKKEPHR